MLLRFKHALPLFLLSAVAAHAQIYKLHGGSVSVGATGQFTSKLTADNTNSTFARVPFGNGLTTYPVTVTNNQQYTTNSVGFLTALQFHPVSWAGVEVNYGFTHYSERYTFNYNIPGSAPTAQKASAPTDMHEATAAYQFRPRHIPFKPFVNVGGGAIDFNPRNASNQWRGAGLLETGFDLPVTRTHIGFRLGARALFYRAPNFYQPVVSTQSWRATVQPNVSTYYRF